MMLVTQCLQCKQVESLQISSLKRTDRYQRVLVEDYTNYNTCNLKNSATKLGVLCQICGEVLGWCD